MNLPQWFRALVSVLMLFMTNRGVTADEAADLSERFSVGFAKRDITPQKPMPMWGYGARHDMLSQGVLTPLFAKAIVIQAGEEKLALVGLDIGRGPTREMTDRIRQELEEKAGIRHVMISGSHTHHGPCIELLDRVGYGKGKFDDAVAYNQQLPGLLIEAILEADKLAQPAKMAVASKEVTYNRNRQSKRPVRATDPMLAVMRFDDEAGKPIAVLVNFAAHPVMTEESLLKFSADYPGFLQNKVEADLQTNCVFMQGASGDMSPNPPGDFRNPQAFGELLAGEVTELAKGAETVKPKRPSVRGKVDHYAFPSRVDFGNAVTVKAYEVAFYPELIQCFVREMEEGVTAECNTVLLNGDVALVGGSGEFFSSHSKRLKERSYVGPTLFFGYCNDHNMYFPTIEAISEGGYGADPPVSPAAVGAGEVMMNQALINLYEMASKIPKDGPRAK
ncbi:MAG: neutral/alkaline non-lysosomal ceramidase N-terminal domain-containing protein [Planctomycetaceae bacterium]